MCRYGYILSSVMEMKRLLIVLVLVVPFASFSQEGDSALVRREFKKFDIFPAISYSPETKLTLGVLGFRYLDLAKTDPSTTLSYINFLAIYTTANQSLVESNWDLFTDGNRHRIRGAIGFSRFPNRNYGLGNDAGVRLTEYTLGNQGVEDSVQYNYKRYSIMRFRFQPSFLWEIRPYLYGGFSAEFENVWNYEQLADSVNIVEGAQEIALLEAHTLGLRSGLGLSFIWDSRDYLLNSSSGSYLFVEAMVYGPYIGSEYTYTSLLFDARKFLNPVANHTLAIRGLLNYRFTNDESLPLRGLSRVGGNAFVRGYFQGTYQSNHVVGFETEYRIPFWDEDNLAPFHQFWKRLGMTVFVSGGQVYNQQEAFQLSGFNVGAGAGLRILFNNDSRANLRIDYAFGLSPDSGGPGKQQRGLYFFFGEAF